MVTEFLSEDFMQSSVLVFTGVETESQGSQVIAQVHNLYCLTSEPYSFYSIAFFESHASVTYVFFG